VEPAGWVGPGAGKELSKSAAPGNQTPDVDPAGSRYADRATAAPVGIAVTQLHATASFIACR
jgi:hypothetical protein